MSFPAGLIITAINVLVVLASSASGAVPFAQPTGWPQIRSASKTDEQIGPGVMHTRWRLTTASGPLELSIAAVDLRNPYVTLSATSHNNVILGSDERLSAMANRLHAEIGINADYFDINESGAPLNVLVENGRIIHQPDAAAAFVVFAGNRVAMQPVSWRVTITSAAGTIHEISTLNEWSAASTVSLLTDALGQPNAYGALEIVFSPLGDVAQTTNYQVSAISPNVATLLPLAPHDVALAAHGPAAQALAQEFTLGDSVTIQTQSDPPLADIQAAVGGGPLLLKDGQSVVDPAAPAPEETNVRNPVSAAGLSADGSTLWLVVVDGRSPGRSIGLTRPMLAALMTELGASTAMAFDSGGSSELVVRHLGDPIVSVANIPSDGRERGIADGLFVVNTAPIGPPAQLLIRAPAQAVLVGSHIQLSAAAVDENEQPIALAPGSVRFQTDPAAAASVDANGLLLARQTGDAIVTAQAAQTRAAARLAIVERVAALRIEGMERMVPVQSREQLHVAAFDTSGRQVAFDAGAVTWRAAGFGGRVSSDGIFSAARQPGVTDVSAELAGVKTQLRVLSGDHTVAVQPAMAAGPRPPQWHYAAQPSELAGSLDNAPAPDGVTALHLRYDFASAAVTRAAYADSTLRLCGRPLGVALDVFGDGHNAWLRAGYRNADGNNESLTLARHIDWRGWKTVHASIPDQAAWPLVWTRFYLVERDRTAQEQGEIWLRNFSAIYPGPAALGCAEQL